MKNYIIWWRIYIYTCLLVYFEKRSVVEHFVTTENIQFRAYERVLVNDVRIHENAFHLKVESFSSVDPNR